MNATRNLRIACRFLTARRNAMLMSLSCTVLGVGLFILTQAATTGFKQFFIATILGTDGALRVEDRIQATVSSLTLGLGDDGVRYVEGVEEPLRILDLLRSTPGVTGASGVLRASVEIQNPFKSDSGQVYGIDVENHLASSDLGRQVAYGSLAAFQATRNGALIGTRMAERLALTVGSPITLNFRGEQRNFVIHGIYETGVEDIDKTRVYVHLPEARSLLRKQTGVTFIQITLADPDAAPELSERLQDILGHSVTPWQERESSWLSAFNALSMSSAITVSVFTLIAGLAMFNTLAMMVMEKTKDIAILRSMGYERADITSIFLWQAAIVLAVGAVLGAAVGAGGTFAISRIPLPINGIFKTETYQVTWSQWHYIAAVLTTTVMVMAASLLPARRAARLEPGDIIRGTAQ
jgi:lipoprotein-releasing system permease protein